MILTSSDDENKRANKSERQATVKFLKVLFNTVYILSFIVVCAILISEFLLPVVRIYDDSMNSTLKKDDIVVLYKTKSINNGDLVAFYVGNKLLVKRCVATDNDVVDIDVNGNVSINGEIINENYVSEKEYGNVQIDLPYRVENDSLFVLSDVRSDLNDSRNILIASINKEQILGKVLFKFSHK